jgi:putative hydrolase of the HAD superfamily
VDFDAVIFDYYGTLTVSASAAVRRAGVDRVAGILGIPSQVLFDTISSTFTERATGRSGDMETTMAWVARRCGYEPSAAQLRAARSARTEIEQGYASMLRHDTVSTLRSLRRQGLRIGVVSDCTHELPAFWDRLAVAPLVDATVFSVLVGRRKPHASLYRAVCRQLGVTPSRALYVGDGGSNELSGARSVGIQAIRLVAPDAIDALVYDAEEDWSGPVIESLGALIEESAPDPTNGEWRPPAGAGR